MTDSSKAVRRYSEEEVAELLRRATEQASSTTAVGDGEGLSLAELQAIGTDVGIAPERLAMAARDMDAEGRSAATPLMGAPAVLHAERRVSGVMAEEDVPELLATIRKVMGQPGTVSEVHGAFEWNSGAEGETRHVSISSKDGVTTVAATSNITSAAVVSLLPAGALGLVGTVLGLGTFAKSGTMLGLALGLTILPSALLGARQLFKRVSRSEARKVEAVAQELAARIEDSSSD